MKERKNSDYSKVIPPERLLMEKLVYQPAGFTFQELKIAAESADYGACEFSLNRYTIKFRVGKSAISVIQS